MPNLKGFNKNQIEAVQFIDGACVIIAGAGSGKTRVLIYRIANLIEHGIKPEHILAMTFTKKASDEMKERLQSLIDDDFDEVNLGTFHSICWKILREEWRALNDPRKDYELAPDWWQKKAVKEIMQPRSQKYPNGINLDWMPKQALSFIGFQKNNLIFPEGSLIISEGCEWLEDKLVSLYKLYEEKKRYEKKIDFDDMLILCWKLFIDHPEIVARYRNMYRYILVDEYQDTNIAQNEILKLLACVHKNLVVVGDDKQAIYGFRAGRVDLIIEFAQQWNAKTIFLDINYRSTANIVEWSNRLISHNENQVKQTCEANQKYGEEPQIIKTADEEEEGEIIAEEITTLFSDGFKPKDFAILYRTNAQSRALEEAMVKAKIPYIVLGSANFYERKEIKDVLAYLALTQDLDNDEALERIINRPNRFLGKAFIEELHKYANRNDCSLYEALRKAPVVNEWRYQSAKKLGYTINDFYGMSQNPCDLLKLIREQNGYDEWLKEEDDSENEGDAVTNDRVENLNSLCIVASRFKTVADFLEFIETMKKPKKDDNSEQDKVKLMSIHRSKGLEFPVVFVAGVNDGTLPHAKATDVEEERRLAYVAMTRAKKLLYLTYSLTYQNKEAGESIFIQELQEMENESDQKFSWI